MWRNLRTIGFALLLVAARSWGAEIAEEDGVLVLDPENFQDALAQNPTLLVEFYAPWCGHCKKLAPVYVQAAEELAKDGLKIAKVDADKHKELAKEYGVSGFPTLKLLKEGKVSDYTSGRSKDDIVNFVRKKSGPPAKTLNTEEDAKSFEGEGEAVVIGLFADVESAPAKAYMGTANGIDRLPFAISSSDELRKAYGGSEGDKVVIIKRYDEGTSKMDVTPETTEEAITDFVETYSMRLVTVFSPETSALLFGGPVKVHLLFMSNGESDAHAGNIEALSKAAEKQRGKMLHVHVPHTEERVLSYFGASEDTLPMAVIADMSSSSSIKKYILEGEFSYDALAAFQEKYFAGELTPNLKSEEPAEEDMAEPVKVIKGKNFKELVIDTDKDVLVEFYAPWCGHCKALAPKYTKLAEKLEPVESVMIAKLDATENEIDVDGIEVSGFPTLYFLPGKSKDTPILYTGGRDVDDLFNFIKEHASTPFTLPEPEPEPEAEPEAEAKTEESKSEAPKEEVHEEL